MVGLLMKRLRTLVRDENGWPGPDDKLFSVFKSIISGDPVGPSAILSLDDNWLLVFIQYLSELTTMDETVADLARRIVSRDLFKIVPCEEDALSQFLSRPDGHERIQAAIKPFVPGNSSCYYHIDNANFSVFAESSEESGYFVDMESEDRKATRIRDHPQLTSLVASDKQRITRLFAPREAVESLTRVVAGK
jgi:hypothetical protein